MGCNIYITTIIVAVSVSLLCIGCSGSNSFGSLSTAQIAQIEQNRSINVDTGHSHPPHRHFATRQKKSLTESPASGDDVWAITNHTARTPQTESLTNLADLLDLVDVQHNLNSLIGSLDNLTIQLNGTTEADDRAVHQLAIDEISRNLTLIDEALRKLADRLTASAVTTPVSHQKKSLPDHFSENFDFNPGDLEDLQDDDPTTLIDEFDESELARIEPRLKQFTQTITGTGQRNNDERPYESKHIYKVPKSKPKHTKLAPSMKLANNPNSVSGHRVFRTGNSGTSHTTGAPSLQFLELIKFFDHSVWNVSAIEANVSPECGKEMTWYLQSLQNGMPWALKASDTSGRYRGQFLFGNQFWLGASGFCNEITRDPETGSNAPTADHGAAMAFTVTRITIKMTAFLTQPKTLLVGECLPKTCTTTDVAIILSLDPAANAFIQLDDHDRNHSVTVHTNRSNELTIADVRTVPGDYNIYDDRRFYVLCSVVGIVIILVCVATVAESWSARDQQTSITLKITPVADRMEMENRKNFDIYQINNGIENNNISMDGDAKIVRENVGAGAGGGDLKQGKSIQFLLCFAAGSNIKTILSVEKPTKDSLTCIHGMRLMSLLWTIMVHTYLQLFAIGENRFKRTLSEQSFLYQIVGNATFSVDTFFFIGGLLVTLLFYRNMKIEDSPKKSTAFLKRGISKTLLLTVYRYLRLTPAYLFVIIFNELSLRYTYDRSAFSPGIFDHLTCRSYWWRNILYINNWFSVQEICMIWSWYLANDMQFYVMAAVLLMFSSRYFKASSIVGMLILFSSWITSAVISVQYNYTHKVSEPFESFDFLYDKPWQRVGPYIMGMLTGYIVHRTKTPPKLSCILQFVLWLCSVSILFSLVFGVWNGELNVVRTAFYVSVGHTAWGFALIWITLACCWGFAKPINNIFSYRALLPLSRLTYCTYLVHPVVMMVTSFQMEGPMHMQHLLVLTVFLGNAVISFVIAFVISVLFEAPVIKLLKILFKK